VTEPIWILAEDCHAAHDKLLQHFGGMAGVRDGGMLDSALGRPRQAHHDGERNLFVLAARYAHGIAKNRPFLDGNKRTAFVMAALFLQCNGWRVVAPEESVVAHTLALAAGEIGEAEYAGWLETSCEPLRR